VSPDNRQANIEEELRQCDEAMRAAEALRGLDLLRDAASRLYYAAYHAARAILLSKELEPTTHQGVLSMLGLNFIKPGLLPAGLSQTFRRLQAFRESADYTLGFIVTAEELDNDIFAARDFVAHVPRYLAAGTRA